jgi:hypothetical protein
MSPSQLHQLRNILTVVLGAIETGNLELAKQAVQRAADHLASCKACPILQVHDVSGLMERS